MKRRGLTAIFLVCAVLSTAALWPKKGGGNSDEIEALSQKVKTLSEAGDLQRAITASEDMLALTLKEYGEKDLRTAEAMNNTANLYLFSGNAENAERLYKDAILVLVNKKPKDSIEAADYYYNLGMAYAMQKKYDEASKILNQCLQIRVKELGNKNPETRKTQDALGEVWEQQKQLDI